MRFREASAWTTTIVVAAIFGNFLTSALAHPDATIPLLIRASVATIVWEVFIHIVLAARKLPEPLHTDDRRADGGARLIGLSVLCLGAALALAQAASPGLLRAVPLLRGLAQQTLLIDIAAMSVAAAQVAKSIATIILYRAGALVPAHD